MLRSFFRIIYKSPLLDNNLLSVEHAHYYTQNENFDGYFKLLFEEFYILNSSGDIAFTLNVKSFAVRINLLIWNINYPFENFNMYLNGNERGTVKLQLTSF